MNKDEKTTELVQLIEKSPVYAEASKIDDRTYEVDGRFVRFHDVSTGDPMVFYGFKAVNVPNPAEDFAQQLENLCEIYTDEQIVKGCLKSIVIESQQAARKIATGKVQVMPVNDFRAAWDKLTTEEPEVIQRLKTYEYIEKHIRDTWLEAQPKRENGQLRIF